MQPSPPLCTPCMLQEQQQQVQLVGGFPPLQLVTLLMQQLNGGVEVRQAQRAVCGAV